MGQSAGLHEWSLPQDPRSCGQARELVYSTLSATVPAQALDDLLLSVSELVSNAVRYGEAFDDGSIRLRVEIGSALVRVAVADAGSAFEWLTKGRPFDQVGGYGLDMLDRLSGSWGLSMDGVKAVWCEIPTREEDR
jgi:anti-sigma regulatory factor (Ser/Thr protein kinase)